MVQPTGLGHSSGRDPPLLIEFESHSRDSKKSIRIQAQSQENRKIKNPFISNELLIFQMVQPTGLEPVTSSFAGRRSNPTELRLHIFWMSGLYVFFTKCKSNCSVASHKNQIPWDPSSIWWKSFSFFLFWRIISHRWSRVRWVYLYFCLGVFSSGMLLCSAYIWFSSCRTYWIVTACSHCPYTK